MSIVSAKYKIQFEVFANIFVICYTLLGGNMQTLISATNNINKVKEFREILGDKFIITSLKEQGIGIEIEEDADTFYGNALKKAKTISELTGMPALADDSGLIVEALGGAPGVYSARYGGEDGNSELNRRKLLAEMEGITDRRAKFHTCIVLYYPSGKTVVAEGDTEGKILTAETGTNGFGYDCLFYSDDLKKSFGLATPQEKNAVSHRGRALAALCKKLETE